MKNSITLITLVLSVLAARLFSGCQTGSHGTNARNIVALKIDSGTEKPAHTVQVPFEPGETAPGILQRAAKVETHAVGKHTMGTSIGGVAGKRGDMARHHEINGKSGKKLQRPTPQKAVSYDLGLCQRPMFLYC